MRCDYRVKIIERKKKWKKKLKKIIVRIQNKMSLIYYLKKTPKTKQTTNPEETRT